MTVRAAVASGDAYAAQDVLAHETWRSYAPTALTDVVEASGLGCRTIPAEFLETLASSTETSEVTIAKVLADRAINWRRRPTERP
jgi:hypothetical protein